MRIKYLLKWKIKFKTKIDCFVNELNIFGSQNIFFKSLLRVRPVNIYIQDYFNNGFNGTIIKKYIRDIIVYLSCKEN